MTRDAKEPTWPFAVVQLPDEPFHWYVQGPTTHLMMSTPEVNKQAAIRLRDAFARAYNLGWDGHAEGQQRAYEP